MKTINLRYCYPYYTGDVFVEVSDEVAEVMVQSVREMYNYDRRTRYHKAFYSLDAFDWTEKYALEHSPSAEEIILMKEEQAAYEKLIAMLDEAFSVIIPMQARRIHARYILGKKLIEIAAEEGVSVSVVQQTVKSGLKRMRNYFEKKKWREKGK